MRYSYEINEKVEVRIWDDENPNENGAPFQLQDVHPDGRPWVDRDEAQAWTEAFVNDLLAPAPEPTEE